MHPIDPRTASLEAHRAGAAHDDHRGAACVGVVDGHGRVERPNDVVHESDQRAIGYARIAVGDRNGDLLVQALDDLRVVLSEGNQGIEQATERCAEVRRRIVDVVGLHHLDNHIGAPLRSSGGRSVS